MGQLFQRAGPGDADLRDLSEVVAPLVAVPAANGRAGPVDTGDQRLKPASPQRLDELLEDWRGSQHGADARNSSNLALVDKEAPAPPSTGRAGQRAPLRRVSGGGQSAHRQTWRPPGRRTRARSTRRRFHLLDEAGDFTSSWAASSSTSSRSSRRSLDKSERMGPEACMPSTRCRWKALVKAGCRWRKVSMASRETFWLRSIGRSRRSPARSSNGNLLLQPLGQETGAESRISWRGCAWVMNDVLCRGQGEGASMISASGRREPWHTCPKSLASRHLRTRSGPGDGAGTRQVRSATHRVRALPLTKSHPLARWLLMLRHGAHGGGVLQRGAGHLGRVQDAHLDHVAVGVVGGVEAVVARAASDRVDDHHARPRRRRWHDLAQRLLDGARAPD